MKLKNILLSGLSFVLVAALAIGGTVAYLQDDDSDVNVMTLGNVKIEQHEYERVVNDDGTYKTETIDNVTSYVLKDFTQGKPLVPSAIDTTTWEGWDWDANTVRMTQVGSYGGMQVFKEASNAQDKFVTVKNTGKTDAYVRTLVAVEVGSADASLIGKSYHTTWTTSNVGKIVVDGNTYYVTEYVYKGASIRHENGVLPAGDTSYPNLSQVYIHSRATNEDMEKLDGNGNGTLDILVLSQAVQVAGFENAQTALDTAFGKSADKAAEWFGGTAIPDVLTGVIGVNNSTNQSGTFVLGDNIETDGDASVHSDTRYGYGYEYIIRGGVDYTLNLNGKTIAHKAVNKNANNNAFTYLFVANNAGTKLTIEGEGKVYCNNSEGYTCAIQGKDGTLVTVNGGDYEVDNGIAVWAGAGAHIVINGGSFVNGNATTDHELIYSSGGVIDIYGGFFHNTDGNYTLNIEDRNRATGFINVYGGTYVNFDPSTGGQDPNNIKVADGYKVVSETQANGDVWYTVVAE